MQEQLRNVLSRYITGEISKEDLVKRIMISFEFDVMAPIRSVAIFDENAAHIMAQRVLADLATICPVEESMSLTEVPVPPAEVRVQRRSDRVLLREVVICELLISQEKVLSLAALLSKVQQTQPDVTQFVLIANIDRLIRAGFIERAWRGMYRPMPTLAVHLEKLRDEVRARGIA